MVFILDEYENLLFCLVVLQFGCFSVGIFYLGYVNVQLEKEVFIFIKQCIDFIFFECIISFVVFSNQFCMSLGKDMLFCIDLGKVSEFNYVELGCKDDVKVYKMFFDYIGFYLLIVLSSMEVFYVN